MLVFIMIVLTNKPPIRQSDNTSDKTCRTDIFPSRCDDMMHTYDFMLIKTFTTCYAHLTLDLIQVSGEVMGLFCYSLRWWWWWWWWGYSTIFVLVTSLGITSLDLGQ